MRKFKPRYLTIKEIQQKMRDGRGMPTAIFSAQKKDYIVKPRGTIFGILKKGSKGNITW